MKRKTQDLYLGRAGERYVMSEVLVRHWNVAIPEVDVGDDILVIEDVSKRIIRVQVKTGQVSTDTPGRVTAQFTLSRLQLETPQEPELWYALLGRSNSWIGPILIARRMLSNIVLETQRTSHSATDNINVAVQWSLDGKQAWIRSVDATIYLGAWDLLFL